MVLRFVRVDIRCGDRGKGPPADPLAARWSEGPDLAGGQAEPDKGLGELDGRGDAIDDRYTGGGGDGLVETGHAAAAEADDFGAVVRDGPLGLGDDGFHGGLRSLIELEDGHAAGAHGGASGVETGELEPVLDERDRTVERRDDGILVAEQRGDVAGRLCDVDDGYIE